MIRVSRTCAQAVFTKWRLPIGAAFCPLVWALELVTLPVSWPIATARGDHPPSNGAIWVGGGERDWGRERERGEVGGVRERERGKKWEREGMAAAVLPNMTPA